MADIPIQRKEGRNIWPLLLGLLVLLGILWFVFGRRTTTTAAVRADSTAVASGTVMTDSAAGASASNMASTATGKTTLADADISNVIRDVNAGEVAAGKIAETKASSADVKAYARDMVQEHTSLDKEAAKVTVPAATMNASLRDSIVKANQALSSELESAKSGAAFDKAYIAAQVQGHQNALSFLQSAQHQAQSADLKKVIDAAIPDVQKHLDRARSLQSKIGQ